MSNGRGSQQVGVIGLPFFIFICRMAGTQHDLITGVPSRVPALGAQPQGNETTAFIDC